MGILPLTHTPDWQNLKLLDTTCGKTEPARGERGEEGVRWYERFENFSVFCGNGEDI